MLLSIDDGTQITLVFTLYFKKKSASEVASVNVWEAPIKTRPLSCNY